MCLVIAIPFSFISCTLDRGVYIGFLEAVIDSHAKGKEDRNALAQSFWNQEFKKDGIARHTLLGCSKK